jgi:mannose-6-phosphate isomerase-like protein (cupin superfamily)
MGTQGIVVQPGQGLVANYAPGRSIVLKLRCDETDGSIMMFEATAPVGTKSTLHLHHDSDEVAYVLSGEITFLIGDDVTVGGPVPVRSCHAASGMPGKAPARMTGACCFFTPRPQQAG